MLVSQPKSETYFTNIRKNITLEISKNILGSKSQRIKMNWSNLAPTILEKIMFYAAQNEQQDEQESEFDDSYEEYSSWHNKWLLTIEKLCRVSVHWKKVAF